MEKYQKKFRLETVGSLSTTGKESRRGRPSVTENKNKIRNPISCMPNEMQQDIGQFTLQEVDADIVQRVSPVFYVINAIHDCALCQIKIVL